jgi:hypothetical protein
MKALDFKKKYKKVGLSKQKRLKFIYLIDIK